MVIYQGEEKEKLSFIIPVFNLYKNEEFLNRSIQGLNNYEQLQDCNIIVSDYGSTDKTKELIESYNFTYLYTEPNEREEFNYCKCANHGIAKVKTMFICVLGIDWKINKKVPKLVIDTFKKYNNNILRIKANEIKKEDRRLMIRQTFFRRQHAIKSLGYDERFNEWGNEDVDFVKRIRKVNNIGEKLISEEILAFHIKHPYMWRKGGVVPANIKYLKDNEINLLKNVKNSYWK